MMQLTEEQALFAKWVSMQDTQEGRLVTLLLFKMQDDAKELRVAQQKGDGHPPCDCGSTIVNTHYTSCASRNTYAWHLEKSRRMEGVKDEVFNALRELLEAIDANYAFHPNDQLRPSYTKAKAVLSENHLFDPDMDVPF